MSRRLEAQPGQRHPRSKRLLVVVLAFASLITLAPALHAQQPDPGPLKAESVRRAIEDGVSFIKRRQLDNGTWTEWPNCESGTTALCTLALLNAGVPVDDPVVQKALAYLRTRAPREKVYAVSLQTMVFCAAKQETDALLILKNVRWLEEAQNSDGGWGYTLQEQISDNSNSQFALLALFEGERATGKVRVSQQVWDRARANWESSQNLDGSWGYRSRGETRGTGSMTCAGITSMWITAGKRFDAEALLQGRLSCCEPTLENRALARGLQWMTFNFSVDRNPGLEDVWVLYYLYGLERVGRLTARRFIGKHDWYRAGVTKLVRDQNNISGEWVGGKHEHQTNVSTSLALLFLAKGRRPVVIGKLEYDDVNWNLHPDDAANLVTHVESKWKKDLSWQSIKLSTATVDELLQVPILYISGRQAPDLAADDIQKLREYVLQGGFIFAEPCCDGEAFRAGFERLVEEMFKQEGHKLSALPPEHPVWRMEEPIPAKYVGQLYGMNVSCRTSIMLATRDLSCRWQHADIRQLRLLAEAGPKAEAVRTDIHDALTIGLNVVSYATNREVKFKYEQFDRGEQGALPDNGGRGLLAIALVRHNGGYDAAASALPNLRRALSKVKNVRVAFEAKEFDLTSDQIYDFPILFMHGRNRLSLTEVERQKLRAFVERGGVLLADAICGNPQFEQSFRDEMAKIFPEQKLDRIPPDHPMFSGAFGGYELKSVIRREPAAFVPDQPLKTSERRVEPYLDGILLGERYGVIFSPYDISCALDSHTAVDCKGYVEEDALRIGVNAVLYGVYQPGP